MPAAPAFSVIVVCKNPGPRLHAALASVWEQREAECETIVIDGASTDGSREWIERQQGRLAAWMSAPDTGVYEAMNRGVARARGGWIFFLGADDRLANETVLRDVAALAAQRAADVAVGEISYDDGRVYRLAPKPNPRARNFVHHQGAFYRRELFHEHGTFDASLRVMADYDFNLRLWHAGRRFEALPVRVGACGTGGLSDAGRWHGYREEIAVRHRHFSPARCWLWDAGSVLRWLRKRVVVSHASSHG